jgi:multidrug resistance efflux pump
MKFLSVFFIVFTVTTLLLVGCAKSPEEKELKKSKDKLEIVLEGVIEPSRESKVIARQSEKIKAVNVKNGERVTKGQSLGNFDEYEAKHAYRKALVEYEKAKISARHYRTAYAENNESLANSKERILNTYALYKADNASLSELKNAEDAYLNLLHSEKIRRYNSDKEWSEASKSTNLAAKDIERARLEVERSRYNYAQVRIESPIAGYITDLKMYPDQAVSQGEMIARVIDIDNVNLKGSFSPGIYSYLRKNLTLDVSCLTTPPYKTKGTIREISPVIDSETKRMRIDIPLVNPKYLLQPGDKCVISIEMSRKEAETAGIVTEDKKVFIKSGTK